MTDIEKAEQLRDEILRAAPQALKDSIDNQWIVALLCAEDYLKMRDTFEGTGKYAQVDESLICKAWSEGRSGEFIHMMYGVPVQQIHDILMRNGYHAPFQKHTNYCITDVNDAIYYKCYSQELQDAIHNTYKNGERRTIFSVELAGTPSAEELNAFATAIKEKVNLPDLCLISGRSLPQVRVIVNDLRKKGEV